MNISRSSILKAIFPIGALLALGACDNTIIIGGDGSGGNGGAPPAPCMADADCAAGQICQNGACMPGTPPTCNGQPSPLSCTQTGCPMGLVCMPDPNGCYPSNCGCDPATGTWQCTTDCGQGSHCVQPQQCGPNTVCPDGTICDAATGTCMPTCVPGQTCNQIPCATDADCLAGQICLNGVCASGPQQQCGPNLPLCPMGQVCAADGVCVPQSPQQCGPNTICPSGTICDPATATCVPVPPPQCDPNTPCPAGQVCLNGVCSPGPQQQCGPNSPPCPPGQVCSANGVCVVGGCSPQPEVCDGDDDNCNGTADDGAICKFGSCTNGGCPCMSNAHCQAGETCVNGVCK